MTDTIKNSEDKASDTDNPETVDADSIDKGERIAKALARAGIASRREIERMIADGRISVDGKTLESPAFLVKSLQGIRVDGEVVARAAETRVWKLHKVKGTLTTHNDPEGRPTVFDKLPSHMGRVISVGRLDMNTEGLLLLTNDGALARWMELPANALVRRYRVRVYGRVNPASLDRLKNGITIDGIHYGEVDAQLETVKRSKQEDGEASLSSANTWLNVAIREGKNREVRKVMEHLGLTVNRLIRTHYGPFSLGTLQTGMSAQINNKQLRDAMSDFFESASGSIAAPSTKQDSSKWAKAKKPAGNKPGASRRKKGFSGNTEAKNSTRSETKSARGRSGTLSVKHQSPSAQRRSKSNPRKP
ncbi:pseudouridine synthase [Kordiimonas aquimaris]|uniref:pseudouridine synthase n=1 Tax=Kordiimonas aquimaris TaxID=707591 RepID=UPI0021D240BE|nr:pseudouridine synthase [Kordiimonas aquimaris]